MKRSRDTRDAAVTPAPVNVPAEQACSAIVTHASKHWKDRCGSLFEIEHKIEKTKDRVLLKLGFFDEMDCSHVDELVDMRLPGDWIVDDAVVNVAKKIVVVHLARSRNAALRAKKSVSTTSNQTPADGAEIMRMRVTFEVKEEDAPNVHAAVHRILAAFERPADAKLTKVAHRPGCYVVYLSVQANVVPLQVCTEASELDGYLDMESNQLMFQVDKKLQDVD